MHTRDFENLFVRIVGRTYLSIVFRAHYLKAVAGHFMFGLSSPRTLGKAGKHIDRTAGQAERARRLVQPRVFRKWDTADLQRFVERRHV